MVRSQRLRSMFIILILTSNALKYCHIINNKNKLRNAQFLNTKPNFLHKTLHPKFEDILTKSFKLHYLFFFTGISWALWNQIWKDSPSVQFGEYTVEYPKPHFGASVFIIAASWPQVCWLHIHHIRWSVNITVNFVLFFTYSRSLSYASDKKSKIKFFWSGENTSSMFSDIIKVLWVS